MKAAVAVLLLGAVLIHAQDSSEWGQGNGNVQTNCTCGYTYTIKNAGRIVGGRDAQVNEYPMIAGIVYRRKPKQIFCGGTIITERHVLTAAHCILDNYVALSVVLAEHKVSSRTESKTTIIDVTGMISHEQFNWNTESGNDIALLVLASHIPFGETIGPACFPKANLNIVGQKVRVIGWGHLTFNGSQPDILQKVDLVVQPTSACSRVHKGITEGELCTYTLGKDSCQGDSGGPVIWRDPGTKRYTIVGVVSYGKGCAEPDVPGVNTKVSAYRDWILQKIQQTVPSAAICQNK